MGHAENNEASQKLVSFSDISDLHWIICATMAPTTKNEAGALGGVLIFHVM